MISFRYFFLVLISVLLPAINVSATVLRCEHPDYANKTIEFLRYEDPVSDNLETAFVLEFDAQGKCSFNIDVKTTDYVFADFGIYRGMLFLEPGKTIELKLPPFRAKSFSEEKNPYFQPVAFWFLSKNGNELNDQISALEQQINFLTDKYFNDLYLRQRREVFDSLKIQIEAKMPQNASKTLAIHKELKLQLIEADIFRMRPEACSSVFNNIAPEFWLHPAFHESFNKTFDRQLSFSAQAIRGKEVKEAVENMDLPNLKAFVVKKYKVDGKMADLVLLKLLHDGFYSGEFSKSAIKKLAGDKLFSQNQEPSIRIAAKNILEKFSFLAKGSSAPLVCLNNLTAEKVCTNAETGKFKYLIFVDVETAVCREHLKYLSRIDELFNRNLDIFVILRNTGKQGIEEFFATNPVPGEKLIDVENSAIESYKIRSYPQCFLLDEQHRVVFENTKAPLDGFEQQFGEWYRREMFMRQRNQDR